MIRMDVLIVGSLAYDSLETPAGSVENELGGSASYGGFQQHFTTTGMLEMVWELLELLGKISNLNTWNGTRKRD